MPHKQNFFTNTCKVIHLLIVFGFFLDTSVSVSRVSVLELDSFHITTETPLKTIDDSGKILQETFLPDPGRFSFTFEDNMVNGDQYQCVFKIQYDSDRDYILLDQHSDNQKATRLQYKDGIFYLKKGLNYIDFVLVEKTQKEQCDKLSAFNSKGVKNLLKAKSQILEITNQTYKGFKIDNVFAVIFYFFKYNFKDSTIFRYRKIEDFSKTSQAKQISSFFKEQKEVPFEIDGNEQVINESLSLLTNTLQNWVSRLSDFCSKNQFYESKIQGLTPRHRFLRQNHIFFEEPVRNGPLRNRKTGRGSLQARKPKGDQRLID